MTRKNSRKRMIKEIAEREGIGHRAAAKRLDANPVRTVATGVTEEQRRAFLDKVAAAGVETVFAVPVPKARPRKAKRCDAFACLEPAGFRAVEPEYLGSGTWLFCEDHAGKAHEIPFCASYVERLPS